MAMAESEPEAGMPRACAENRQRIRQGGTMAIHSKSLAVNARGATDPELRLAELP